MSNLNQLLLKRLKAKHTKLSRRFLKGVEEGNFQTLSTRKRYNVVERLKRLEKQIKGMGHRTGFGINLNFRHWAVALALGVVVTTANAQKTNKNSWAPKKSNSENPSAGINPLAQNVFFNEIQQLGEPSLVDLLIGDIDGDGDDDAIYVSYLNPPVLLTNDGGFSFTPSDIAITNQALFRHAELGDFDGDGDLDFLMIHGPYGSPAVEVILINDGSGNFAEQPATVGIPDDFDDNNLIFFDFDGDDDLDYIYRDEYASPPEINVFENVGLNFGLLSTTLGNGNRGTFELFGVADMDGDLDLDIVYRGENTTTFLRGIRILTNDGSGTFTDTDGFEYIVNNLEMGLADIDNDADIDIVIAEGANPDVLITPLIQTAVNTFSPGTPITAAGAQFPDELDVVDVNNDGNAEILLQGDVNRQTHFFENLGSATFASERILPVVMLPANLDGNTDGDFFIGDGNLGTYENQGSFTFASNPDLLVIGASYDTDAVDIDDDGDIDIVQGGIPRVWLNDGNASFTLSQELKSYEHAQQVFGDLDDDGDPDMVVIADGNAQYIGMYVWRSDAGTLALVNDIGAGVFDVQDLVVVDLDGDLDLDIAAIVKEGLSQYFLRTFHNEGGFSFIQFDNYAISATDDNLSLSAGNFDADSDVDIALYNNGVINIYLNEGGSFTNSSTIDPSTTLSAFSLQLGDLDGDLDLDIFASNTEEYTLNSFVFLNNGLGVFTEAPAVVPAYGYQAALADMDNDGDLDIITTDYGTGINIFTNDGAANFTKDDINLGASDEYGVPVFGDFDGDGDQDLVIGGYYTATRVFSNESSICTPININPDIPVLVDLNDECAVTPPTPTATTNCSVIFNGVADVTFPITTQGTTVVTWTYDDGQGNTTTQTQNVIIDDVTDPIAVTQPAIVDLNRAGNGTLAEADVDGGSSDNCGVVNLSLDRNSFTLADLGDVQVTLTVEDDNGNSTSDNATVTVVANPIYYDSLALVDLFNNTGGASWNDNSGWLSGNLDSWAGVTVNGDRVTILDLSDNQVTGTIPATFNDLTALTTVNLSGNEIDQFDTDLSGLLNLTSINLSNNKLDFGDLELLGGVSGLVFDQQTTDDLAANDSIPVGTDISYSFIIDGSNNAYQWFKDGSLLDGETANTVNITSIDRASMGEYVCESTNTNVPGLTLTSASKRVTATAVVDGQFKINDTDPVDNGIVRLLRVTDSGGFDSTAFDLLVPADNGTYSMPNIALADYVLVGFADTTVHPDAIPTYFSNTVFWAEADTLVLEADTSIDLVSVFSTNPTGGGGMFSGTLDEEIPDGGRIEARGRVRGVGVTMRRGRRTSREEGTGELVYYVYTNDNGEFNIDGIDAGEYNLDIQYPGYPMDEDSFLDITIGDGPKDSEVVVEALVDNGVITVTQLIILGTNEPENGLVLFPNPTSDWLNIQDAENRSDLSVEIFNTSGTRLKQLLFTKEGSVSVNDLPVGQYIVKVLSGSGEELLTRRILIENR